MENEVAKTSEIVEGNKLIAEFMGATLKLGSVGTYVFSESPSKEYSGSKFWHSSKLDYHDSWDWLMPVVEKIESIENGTYGLTADPWGIEIREYQSGKEGLIKRVYKDDGQSKIWLYWNVVIEFIEWHNINKLESEK